MKHIAFIFSIVCIVAASTFGQGMNPQTLSREVYTRFANPHDGSHVYVKAQLDGNYPAYGYNNSTNEVVSISSFADTIWERFTGTSSLGWDSPASQDGGVYLPWGKVNFTANFNTGTTLQFSIDFRDEKWTADSQVYGSDTYLFVDSAAQTCRLWRAGMDTLQLSNNSYYSIWSLWDVDQGPTNPSNLEITNTAASPIHLSWQTNTGVVVFQYQVWRKVVNGDGVWNPIGAVTTNSYTDNDYIWFSQGGNFSLSYKVQAEDNFGGVSAASNTVSCTGDENGNRVIAITQKGNLNSENNIEGGERRYSLHQNYPNPFNPSTRIYYELRNASHVSLRVYNTLGQELVTLVDADQQPGAFSVKFDGSALASGIYFCRLEASGFVATRQLVVLK